MRKSLFFATIYTMNPLRAIIQKTGFDFHRHYVATDKLEFLKTFGIQTVLDIGANEGQFAKEIRGVLPEAFIYSFEPLREICATLEKNMNADRHFKAFRFALGDQNTDMQMEKNEYSPSSSILPLGEKHKALFPHARQTSKETITVKTLDAVLPDLRVKKEILIKVDVQGFEDKVITGGENAFRQAKAIIMETSFVELYQNQPTFDDIYETLKHLGFSYCGSLQEKVDKKTGHIVSEDSLFVTTAD